MSQISLRLELISTQSSGFKKEGMRSCTGEGWVAKILFWMGYRQGCLSLLFTLRDRELSSVIKVRSRTAG